MTKLTVAAGVACALFAGSALAADLPSRKAPPVYVPPPPVFSWNGLYGGINVGYGFGNGDQDVGGLAYVNAVGFPFIPLPSGAAWSLNNNLQGVVGGGQVGYNYQFNPWLVVGLEADIQASDIHSQSATVAGSPSPVPFGPHAAFVNQTKSVDWFGTVRGRLGVTLPSLPNLLVYGTAGFAYGQVVHNAGASDFYSFGGAVLGGNSFFDDTKTGWTAGGGVEWFPLPASPLFSAFSVKAEYLYTDLGSTTVNGVSFITFPPGGPTFAYTQTSQTRFHTVRAGLNWHFNPFAPAPVVAKF